MRIPAGKIGKKNYDFTQIRGCLAYYRLQYLQQQGTGTSLRNKKIKYTSPLPH